MGGAFIQGETERASKKGPFKMIPFEETGLFCNPPQTGEGALGKKNEQKQKVQRRDYWLLQQPAISQICNICNPPPPNNDFKQYAASNLSNQQFALEEYLR